MEIYEFVLSPTVVLSFVAIVTLIIWVLSYSLVRYISDKFSTYRWNKLIKDSEADRIKKDTYVLPDKVKRRLKKEVNEEKLKRIFVSNIEKLQNCKVQKINIHQGKSSRYIMAVMRSNYLKIDMYLIVTLEEEVKFTVDYCFPGNVHIVSNFFLPNNDLELLELAIYRLENHLRYNGLTTNTWIDRETGKKYMVKLPSYRYRGVNISFSIINNQYMLQIYEEVDSIPIRDIFILNKVPEDISKHIDTLLRDYDIELNK